MINVNVDTHLLIELVARLEDSITPSSDLYRVVATDMVAMMTDRIHIQGKNSDGAEIGQYTSRYLKLRQGKYKRSSDGKIIISLTRQLENDWAVLRTDNGGWGIGFNNPHNADKAKWQNEMHGISIFKPTVEERDFANETANIELEKIINPS